MTAGKRDPDQEASYDRGYELGKIVALEDLSKKLRERAGASFGSARFSTGGFVDDKEAYLLRNIGDEVGKEAEKMREAFNKKHHPELVRA